MFDQILDPADTAAAPNGPRTRMARLQRLSEIGLDMAERLNRQSELAAVYAETCAVPEHLRPPYARRLDEIARAFAQLSRAVTLAVALEDRIETDLNAGPAAVRDRAPARAAAAPIAADRPASNPAGADGPDLGEPRLRLDRFLNADLAELDALLSRPPDEIIARIRNDLDAVRTGGLAARDARVDDPGLTWISQT